MIKADISQIKADLNDKGYSIFRQAEFQKTVTRAKSEYQEVLGSLPVNAPTKAFSQKDLAVRPWKKFAIGSRNGVGESYAQLLQTTYFLEGDSRFPHLSEAFGSIISLRNEIVGADPQLGSPSAGDGFWNACRIHHYPRGGGFMSAHKDSHFPPVLGKSGHPFLQLMLLFSNRGPDFETGGGFVIDRQGKKVLFENENSIGTIVAFDGSITHGVDDIDPDRVLNLDFADGRIAAFVSLYKTY